MTDEMLASVQEQILEIVRKTEETIVEAGRTMAKAVTDATPDATPLAELVDDAFDLTEKVLKSQRELARGVMQAIASGLGAPEGWKRAAPPVGTAAEQAVAPTRQAPAGKAASRGAPVRKAGAV